MNPFRGDEFGPAVVMARGRGRGRGATRANPDDNEPVQAGQGQVRGQDQFQAVGRARVSATELSSSSSSSSETTISSVGSTWESADNLSMENYRKIFEEPKKLSSEVNSPEVIDKQEEEEEKVDEEEEEEKVEEEKKPYLPEGGYLGPQSITLSALTDTIKAGEERYCAVYTMVDTDTAYLIFSKYFSHAVDNFIRWMGCWYFGKVWEGKLLSLNVREEQLVAGAIVVVYHKQLREWKRAKVLEPYDGPRGRMYKVLFLDLGDFADVSALEIVYMHEKFKDKPVFAVRARLLLSPFYSGKKVACGFNWNKVVSETILESVHNKMVLVKFFEQVEFDDEKTWNVSLLSMKDRPGFDEDLRARRRVHGKLSGNQPIEKQIIARCWGGMLSSDASGY